MDQVIATSAATEPVARVRSVKLRDPARFAEPSRERAAAPSAAETSATPAAVIQIGPRARALARRHDGEPSARPRASDVGARRPSFSARPPPSGAPEAASSAALSVPAPAQRRDNPLAAAAESAAEALWGEVLPEGELDDAGSLAEVPRSAPHPGELTAGEQRRVEEMAQRDRQVRAEEQSRTALGFARYEYRMGPDGKLYAVEGMAPGDVPSLDDAPQGAPDVASDAPARDADAARLLERARAEHAAARYEHEQRALGDVAGATARGSAPGASRASGTFALEGWAAAEPEPSGPAPTNAGASEPPRRVSLELVA